MIYYIIPLIIVVISLATIIYIIIKKLPSLALINVESIAKEKEAKVKNRIMVERLARNFLNLKKFLSGVFTPFGKIIAEAVSNFYQKTIELEKKNLQNKPLKQIDINQQIQDKLVEAKKYLTEGDLNKVEEVCISIIELNEKNVDVYELLTKAYIEKKEYKKARETSRYLVKLLSKIQKETESSEEKHRLANCYADLGYIYQLENKPAQALANFQKAVDLEPSNPRFLDLLLKISIILKDKNLAKQVFTELKKADPENQKLAELKDEIDSLPDK